MVRERGAWHRLVVGASLSVTLGAAACGGGARANAQQHQAEGPETPPVAMLGPQAPTFHDTLRFITHDEHVQPGLARQGRTAAMTNPYEGNAHAIAVGSKLFVSYNCMDCHGADGSGAMGPSLQDGRWHFGGSPGAVFESIYEGRADGMPAWGGRISEDQIWMLVTYVRSLSLGRDVSTENFTGATTERTGHE